MADEGRPTKYREEFAEQAYKLAMLGMTDSQMAEFFCVCDATVDNWKNEFPEFLGSIRRGKTLADAETAVSLYKRANGYSHPAVKIFMPAGASAPVVVDYVEHYPPDTPAASLWLRNRQRALWRDATNLQNLDKDGNPADAPTTHIYQWAAPKPE